MMSQVLVQYGDIKPFVLENWDISPATRAKLLEILNDPQQQILFKMELASMIHVGAYFVRATYELEGDGVLVLTCY